MLNSLNYKFTQNEDGELFLESFSPLLESYSRFGFQDLRDLKNKILKTDPKPQNPITPEPDWFKVPFEPLESLHYDSGVYVGDTKLPLCRPILYHIFDAAEKIGDGFSDRRLFRVGTSESKLKFKLKQLAALFDEKGNALETEDYLNNIISRIAEDPLAIGQFIKGLFEKFQFIWDLPREIRDEFLNVDNNDLPNLMRKHLDSEMIQTLFFIVHKCKEVASTESEDEKMPLGALVNMFSMRCFPPRPEDVEMCGQLYPKYSQILFMKMMLFTERVWTSLFNNEKFHTMMLHDSNCEKSKPDDTAESLKNWETCIDKGLCKIEIYDRLI